MVQDHRSTCESVEGHIWVPGSGDAFHRERKTRPPQGIKPSFYLYIILNYNKISLSETTGEGRQETSLWEKRKAGHFRRTAAKHLPQLRKDDC